MKYIHHAEPGPMPTCMRSASIKTLMPLETCGVISFKWTVSNAVRCESGGTSGGWKWTLSVPAGLLYRFSSRHQIHNPAFRSSGQSLNEVFKRQFVIQVLHHCSVSQPCCIFARLTLYFTFLLIEWFQFAVWAKCSTSKLYLNTIACNYATQLLFFPSFFPLLSIF